ncbi:hypothetical protein TWF694_010473 [Orbilia ellipsospora]|uniref:Uncharacterized protein n=1 Tax=Orbilia ellipsospora TaxID=2528407 RepID=A0AAV9XCP1_9PEZI
MGKGESNPVTDVEFLQCCLEAAAEVNIDYSLVSKATGYAHGASARTRLRKIRTATKSCVKEYQTSNKDGHEAASTSEGPETRSKKKKSKLGDDGKDSPRKLKTEKGSHEEEKRVTRSKTSTARSGAKDGK